MCHVLHHSYDTIFAIIGTEHTEYLYPFCKSYAVSLWSRTRVHCGCTNLNSQPSTLGSPVQNGTRLRLSETPRGDPQQWILDLRPCSARSASVRSRPYPFRPSPRLRFVYPTTRSFSHAIWLKSSCIPALSLSRVSLFSRLTSRMLCNMLVHSR